VTGLADEAKRLPRTAEMESAAIQEGAVKQDELTALRMELRTYGCHQAAQLLTRVIVANSGKSKDAAQAKARLDRDAFAPQTLQEAIETAQNALGIAKYLSGMAEPEKPKPARPEHQVKLEIVDGCINPDPHRDRHVPDLVTDFFGG